MEFDSEATSTSNVQLQPYDILLQLAFKGMPVQKAKLINFFAHYKKLKFGDCTIQLHTIHDWCKLNSVIPESEDDVFVPNYQADEFDKAKMHICADATYKLIWQGYPVLIIGATDIGKKFHPFGLSISIKEEHTDFAFIFSLKDAVKTLFDVDYQPTTLIADASAAITNGFVEAFESIDFRVMCWAHLLRNFDKHLVLITGKEARI